MDRAEFDKFASEYSAPHAANNRASGEVPDELACRTVTVYPAIRYALVGVSNTIVGFAVIWLALRVLGFGDVAANATGYAVGFLWSFALNRRWTFGHRGALHAGFLRYVLVSLVAYGANLVVLIVLGGWLGSGQLVSQFLAMLTYSVLGYLGARHWAFPAAREGSRSW